MGCFTKSGFTITLKYYLGIIWEVSVSTSDEQTDLHGLKLGIYQGTFLKVHASL